MKRAICAAALLGLSACATAATAPDNAVPFAQVLADNTGRSVECTNYDAATDSCEGVATYTDLGAGRYAFAGNFILAEGMPVARLAGTLVARGALICTDFADVTITSAEGSEDLSSQLTFAEMESLFSSVGETCAAYIPAGDGYTVRAVTGPAFMRMQPDQRAQFFRDTKSLRAPTF